MKVADGRIDSAAYPLFAAADSLGIMELGICYFSDVPDQLNFIGRDSARVFYVHIGLGSVMWELRDAEISIDPNRMATGLRIFHEFKIPHPYIVIDESKLQLTTELYKIVYEVNLIQYLSKETLKKIDELYEKEYTATFELNAKAVEEFLKRNKEVDYVVIQDKIYFVSEKLTREGKTVYELLGTIDIDKVGWASRPAVLTDDAVKMLIKALPRKNTTIHVSFGNAEFTLVEVTIKNVDAVMRIFVKEIPISEYREKVIGFLASEAHMPVYTEEEIEMKKKAMEAARKRVEEELRFREEKEIADKFRNEVFVHEADCNEAFKTLISIRDQLEKYVKEGYSPHEALSWTEEAINTVRRIIEFLNDYRELVEKTANEMKSKYPWQENFINDLVRIAFEKCPVETRLNTARTLLEKLQQFRNQLKMEIKERKEKPLEKPPERPPEKPPEKPPSEVERLYEEAVREKLRFYTRMKLLEAGVPLGAIEGMMRMLLDNVELLAEDVIAKVISQKDAERRIDELVKSVAETIQRQRLRREDIVRQLENEYLSFLREQGVRNVRQVLEAVKEDIESLVDEVVAGRMSLDEALQRVREIPVPPIAQLPKPEIVTREVAPERVPAAEEIGIVVSPREAAEMMWDRCLDQILIFGFRYAYEHCGRELGIPPQLYDDVRARIAGMLRSVGYRLRRLAQEKGALRYELAGDALVRYSMDIISEGLVRGMRMMAPEFYTRLRIVDPSVLREIEATGYEGSIVRAIAGVILDYLGIPRDKWPEDIIACYDALIRAAGIDP